MNLADYHIHLDVVAKELIRSGHIRESARRGLHRWKGRKGVRVTRSSGETPCFYLPAASAAVMFKFLKSVTMKNRRISSDEED